MKKKIVPDPPFPLPKTPYLFAHNYITPLDAIANVEVLTRGIMSSLHAYRDLHPKGEKHHLLVDIAQAANSAHLLAEHAFLLLSQEREGEGGHE
ncbi:hypothetical protein ACLUS7_11540 [Enterobacterales bacterium BD_CKDN230030183-1A_HGKHYDSX7]